MLLQKDVQDEGCNITTRLFIDAFKDRKNFLDEYVKELDKADDVIDIEEMSRTCKTKNSNIYENEDGVVQEEDKDID